MTVKLDAESGTVAAAGIKIYLFVLSVVQLPSLHPSSYPRSGTPQLEDQRHNPGRGLYLIQN